MEQKGKIAEQKKKKKKKGKGGKKKKKSEKKKKKKKKWKAEFLEFYRVCPCGNEKVEIFLI